ncbi:MAG: sensor histidine kinase [Phycisphaerales bacterium]
MLGSRGLTSVTLANKCLFLFGIAAVVIILAALMVPWLRMNALVDDDGVEASRQMVRVWDAMRAQKPPSPPAPTPAPLPPPAPGSTSQPPTSAGSGSAESGVPGAPASTSPDITPLDRGQISVIPGEQVGAERQKEPFIGQAWDRFLDDPGASEFASANWKLLVRHYRYARAIRDERGALTGLVLLERHSAAAARDMIANTVYLASAGLVALGLAILVFYLITQYLILSPVRTLRQTAEQVRQGNLQIRSEIRTGDEFEELAETFNAMLAALQDTQRSLRSINVELDKRVDALETQNVSLHEANRLKGQFLATVSHELRTPLNSIIGFTELLLDIANRELEAGDDSTRLAKRRRYLEIIISSGRSLLDLINGLLELAKIEAGKVDLTIEPIDLREAAEGLLALIRPLADKRGVALHLEIEPGSSAGDSALPGELPLIIHSDRGKLHQIIFNFLSNAVKFTGDAESAPPPSSPTSATHPSAVGGGSAGAPGGGVVTLRVESILDRSSVASGNAGDGAPGADPDARERVRISVLDNGPGIAPGDLDRIFDKFTQLSGGHTRKHAGAGLGLSICKELTHLLQGEIQVQSEPGRGSMFSVILPRTLDSARTAETKLEAQFRGVLAGRSEPAASAPTTGAAPPAASAS